MNPRGHWLVVCLFGLELFHSISAGSVVLIGGNLDDDNDDIYGKFIELAAGAGAARVAVVTAANGNPQGSADFYLPQFYRYGAREVYWVPVHLGTLPENSSPEVVNNVRRMTGVFIGGGDQARLTASFYNTGREVSPVLAALREVVAGGGVVGGTSAGCVGISNPVMVMSGVSWDALRYGAFPSGEGVRRDDLVYDPDGGLGFLDGYVLDSHFSERGREGRLVRLAADTRRALHGADFLLGMDEDTALVITDAGGPNAVGEVLGSGGVFFGDLTQSRVDTVDGYWRIRDVYTDWLSAGDTITMETHTTRHQVTFGDWKYDLSGQEEYEHALTSNDIFQEYVRVARSVFDSRQSASTWGRTKKKPRFVVDFQQVSSSKGYGGYSPNTGQWTISYSELKVDIRPE